MFDIAFYQKVHDLKTRLQAGASYQREALWNELETFRSKEPVIYNIETTNACNMRCEMCPRTTMMTRNIETMDMPTFKKIIAQLRPFSLSEWEIWQQFVEQEYKIDRSGMSENHFFLHIIPKVLVLHGYGDPLLDPLMPERVRLLSERSIPSYFSCNPANIDMEKSIEIFRSGLAFVKYSIESTDDMRHKEVRGACSNFSDSYKKIVKLLDIKEKLGFKTKIVITMLDLKKTWQEEEFERLKQAFSGLDVYLYLKSQDQQWYQDENHGTNSIHWQEFCQFPWSSMTVKSNGEAVMCVEDYNNEIILGDARKVSLKDIWNGESYKEFRRQHLNVVKGIKCSERCDMKLVGSYIR